MSAGSDNWLRRGAKAVLVIDALWTTCGLLFCLWEVLHIQNQARQLEKIVSDRLEDPFFDQDEARAVLEELPSIMQKLWISFGLRVTASFLQGFGIWILCKANKEVSENNGKAVWIYTACSTLSFVVVGIVNLWCSCFWRFGFDLVFRIICLMIVHINRLSGRKEAGETLGSCGTALCWKINLQAEV